jgi:hypothetical protein
MLILTKNKKYLNYNHLDLNKILNKIKTILSNKFD